MHLWLVWLLIFIAGAVPTQVLWSRMVGVLRAHQVSYIDTGYQLSALAAYHRFVRDGRADTQQKRLLLWVYVGMAFTWLAFLGLLVFGVAGG
jgi:hypothetical protein